MPVALLLPIDGENERLADGIALALRASRRNSARLKGNREGTPARDNETE